MTLRQQQTNPEAPAPDGAHYRIFVRGLVLLCSIGAYPEERHRLQRVRFNIDMTVQEPSDPIGDSDPVGDDLANVLSYARIVSDVRRLVDRGHVNLIETLAERVAECCLADPRARDVRVSVEKLDIEPAAGGVGIEIERRRTSYPAAADLLRWGPAEVLAHRRHRGSERLP